MSAHISRRSFVAAAAVMSTTPLPLSSFAQATPESANPAGASTHLWHNARLITALPEGYGPSNLAMEQLGNADGQSMLVQASFGATALDAVENARLSAWGIELNNDQSTDLIVANEKGRLVLGRRNLNPCLHSSSTSV